MALANIREYSIAPTVLTAAGTSGGSIEVAAEFGDRVDQPPVDFSSGHAEFQASVLRLAISACFWIRRRRISLAKRRLPSTRTCRLQPQQLFYVGVKPGDRISFVKTPSVSGLNRRRRPSGSAIGSSNERPQPFSGIPRKLLRGHHKRLALIDDVHR